MLKLEEKQRSNGCEMFGYENTRTIKRMCQLFRVSSMAFSDRLGSGSTPNAVEGMFTNPVVMAKKEKQVIITKTNRLTL
jgi:hypothetical protein